MHLSSKKKKPGIFSFLTGQAEAAVSDDVTIQDIHHKINALVTTIDRLSTTSLTESSTKRIMTGLAEIKREVQELDEDFQRIDTNLHAMKEEISNCFKAIIAEFADIKHYMKMHDVSVHTDSEAAKELQQRIHGILVRAISQIEKADEFTRTTVPEFRSYHKEISKDISDLSRDIALVERSLQNQINTSAVKLR